MEDGGIRNYRIPMLKKKENDENENWGNDNIAKQKNVVRND